MQDLTYQLKRQAQKTMKAESAAIYWKGLAEKRGRIAGLVMLAVFVFGVVIFISWCFGLIKFGVPA